MMILKIKLKINKQINFKNKLNSPMINAIINNKAMKISKIINIKILIYLEMKTTNNCFNLLK